MSMYSTLVNSIPTFPSRIKYTSSGGSLAPPSIRHWLVPWTPIPCQGSRQPVCNLLLLEVRISLKEPPRIPSYAVAPTFVFDQPSTTLIFPAFVLIVFDTSSTFPTGSTLNSRVIFGRIPASLSLPPIPSGFPKLAPGVFRNST